jgi:hypothetical protein
MRLEAASNGGTWSGNRASASSFSGAGLCHPAAGIVNFRQLLSVNYLIFQRIKTGAEIAFICMTGFKFMTCDQRFSSRLLHFNRGENYGLPTTLT